MGEISRPSLAALATSLDAKLLRGDPSLIITGLASLKMATKNQVSFYASRRYLPDLKSSHAAAVIVSASDSELCPNASLVVANPRLALAKLAELFEPEKKHPPAKIHPSVVIGTGCKLASNVAIGPGCVIGDNVTLSANVTLEANIVIGDNCHIEAEAKLFSGATLYANTKLGRKVVIHSGAIVGARGFGFARDKDSWVKIPHLGGVTIEDDVEIGANTTIDRGMLEDTFIARGVIIDNLVQIAHNVEIGENTAIAACTGIAGSTKIGKNCQIGGAVGIAGHLNIADGVVITAKSGVSKDILQPGCYSSGIPTQNARKWNRNLARLKNLDSILKETFQIENQ